MADPWFKVGDHVRGRRVTDRINFLGRKDMMGEVVKVGQSSGRTEGVPTEAHDYVVHLDKSSIPRYQWCFELDTPLSSFDAAVRAYISRELNDTP